MLTCQPQSVSVINRFSYSHWMIDLRQDRRCERAKCCFEIGLLPCIACLSWAVTSRSDLRHPAYFVPFIPAASTVLMLSLPVNLLILFDKSTNKKCNVHHLTVTISVERAKRDLLCAGLTGYS